MVLWVELVFFSFNGNKIITTSGGGALVCNDDALVDKARFLSTQAKEPADYYLHKELGYNYRLSNILAGVGRGQLEVLEQRIRTRRHIFERYQQLLSAVPCIEWMPEADYGTCNRWLSVCCFDENKVGITSHEMIKALQGYNIEARRTWYPLHRQPLFSHCDYYPHQQDQSVSDALFNTGICLPSGSSLSMEHQQKVSHVIYSTLRDKLGLEISV